MFSHREVDLSAYTNVLQQEDDRVYELFDVQRETLDSGSILIEDPFPELGALLQRGAVQKGTLAELMGLGNSGAMFPHHLPNYPTYTAFSFSAVSRCFIESETFSSSAYTTTHVSMMMGSAILVQVGEAHRSLRGAIQPLFTPEAAESWWSKKRVMR